MFTGLKININTRRVDRPGNQHINLFLDILALAGL